MYSPYSGSGIYYGHYGEAPHSHPIQTILTQYWHETHYPGPHKNICSRVLSQPIFSSLLSSLSNIFVKIGDFRTFIL